MKRTTILLEEDLLLEVQQLAKERQVTTSQVIQQAVADYVERQRQQRTQALVESAEVETKEATSPRLPDEQPARATPPAQVVPVRPPMPHESAPAQVPHATAERTSRLSLIPLVLGGLGAIFALLEIVRAIEQFATRARPLEVVVNYLLPGVLLGVVAAALFVIARQVRESGAI